jgi:hypothetical protein
VTREKYEPTGTVELPESLRLLRHAHQQLELLKPRLEAIDPAAVSFPHWVFGPLTLGQWLLFMGYHIQRHHDQIVSITKLPDYAGKN